MRRLLKGLAYALSVRQPWAALLVGGRKSIEIRRWPTAIRGPVYIHAARRTDRRPRGWSHVPADLQPLAQTTGGIIGTAELTSCVVYRTQADFAGDAPEHLNDSSWFVAPLTYGFRFRRASPVAFHPCRGHVRFFRVDVPEES